MSSSNEIKGRLALITGASGGIGAACAKQLILHDVHLALTYSSNALAIEELVAQLRKDHDVNRPETEQLKISIHKADLSNSDECVKLCEEVQKEHGRSVDILVSNAGHGKRIPDIWDISLEEFEYTLKINLTASFILVKCLVEGMKKNNWGRIIFISSIAARGTGVNGCRTSPLPVPKTITNKHTDYAASKGGLTGMMKNLSSKLAPYGITVNDVAPAMIGDTGMIPNKEAIPGVEIPIGRLGYPEECANVVTMYCKTGYATGQSFLLAGGLNHK